MFEKKKNEEIAIIRSVSSTSRGNRKFPIKFYHCCNVGFFLAVYHELFTLLPRALSLAFRRMIQLHSVFPFLFFHIVNMISRLNSTLFANYKPIERVSLFFSPKDETETGKCLKLSNSSFVLDSPTFPVYLQPLRG